MVPQAVKVPQLYVPSAPIGAHYPFAQPCLRSPPASSSPWPWVRRPQHALSNSFGGVLLDVLGSCGICDFLFSLHLTWFVRILQLREMIATRPGGS